MSKKCINCGAQLHDEASFCHACEQLQTEKTKMETVRLLGRRGSVLLGLALMLTVALVAIAAVVGADAPGQSGEADEGTEVSTEPVQYISDHEAIYRNGDEIYRIGVSFGDEPVFAPENSYYSATIGALESYYKWTHLYVLRESDGTVAREQFLPLIQSVYVESFDAASGELRDTVYAIECENKDRPVTMLAGMYFDQTIEKRDLVWHVVLNNGDELTFRQTMEVFAKERLIFTPENAAMNTMEELRALILQIEATATENTEVLIYLPAVTYEGQLELRHGYFFFGSVEDGNCTTFTDTVTCAAPLYQFVRFADVVFDGRGWGTGVIDHCSTELHHCTFRNWDVAVRTDRTGWIFSAGSSYIGNGTAIEFNCEESWYNTSEYPDNYFIDNENAIVIHQIGLIAPLTFPNSVFRGNQHNIVNYTQQRVDFAGAIVE